MTWTVHSLKYATNDHRTRREAFIGADDHSAPFPIHSFIWVLRPGDEVTLVDSGYDSAEAARRGRPILRAPTEALAALGLRPDDITTLIITHLHYDHAGGIAQFPNATLHLQADEMAFATGPCMCHDHLRFPYTGDHICEVVQRLYSGRLVFHQGDGQVADGVTVHRIGGHSRGLQSVRVLTQSGWLCLASDAAHFYENFIAGKPFPLVVDMEDMFTGFETIQALASSRDLVIPGHDPLVQTLFPTDGPDFVRRLDRGPIKPLPFDT